jgi:16S rRNA (adenine1518-N6/adenine1519-N6)-dimethyltransferase
MYQDKVRAKKFLGQHFLKDNDIAIAIADAVGQSTELKSIVEVGPGMGVLTSLLLERNFEVLAVEIDRESVAYLKEHLQHPKLTVLEDDFLRDGIEAELPEKYAVAGNFPYHISSQILFRCLAWKDNVVEITGMFQKEVAQRIVAPPGSKTYGILSVLMALYFDGEYLFTVKPESFIPPPKVDSGVVRFKRHELYKGEVNEVLFFKVVKMAFNQRRKTLRNALKPYFNIAFDKLPFSDKRAEQLGVKDFIFLVNEIETYLKNAEQKTI